MNTTSAFPALLLPIGSTQKEEDDLLSRIEAKPQILEYPMYKKYTKDRKFMWRAVVRNGNAYQYADNNAVKYHTGAVKVADGVILQPYSFELALKAVQKSNGMQLQYVPTYDKLGGSDKYSRVALSAVSINPNAYEYVDEEFKDVQDIKRAIEARRNLG